jgi:hypothetical protein
MIADMNDLEASQGLAAGIDKADAPHRNAGFTQQETGKNTEN